MFFGKQLSCHLLEDGSTTPFGLGDRLWEAADGASTAHIVSVTTHIACVGFTENSPHVTPLVMHERTSARAHEVPQGTQHHNQNARAYKTH